LPPDGDWATWVLRAGRGFGKTRTGSGWVHERAIEHPGRWIALVARTPADARDYMIEGPGGLLRNTHPRERPLYEPSKRRLTWPNRSWATIYSDEEPDQCRGFSGDTAWLDELAKFQNATETWHCLAFGMRETSSDRPRILVTTTPRPIPILAQIERLPSTVVVQGSSYENARNLDPRWFDDALTRYEGTRLGRQEIDAEILDDTPGALWTREVLEKSRAILDEHGPVEIRKSVVTPANDLAARR
jgi:phage terminase large subunit-like protein